ncbi:hypothetical protein IQA64_14335 [Leptospira borgpetersenii serovar Tarassovi]|nr:hypothetical protein [Leptospira borgpetersenii serovar Tarassovi]
MLQFLRNFHYNRFRILLYRTHVSYQLRQNGAPSGLEKRGLDASIYHKTKKPTEGTQ